MNIQHKKLLVTPLKSSRFLGLAGLTFSTVLVGCAGQQAQPLELEETVDIAPLEDHETAEGSAPDVAEPEFPEVAQQNSPEGAKATVEYFWEGIDYVRQTGHAQPAASVSYFTCDICTESIFRWQQIHEAGAWATLDGATEIEIVETQSYLDEENHDEWTAVIFNVTEPASDFYLDGELVEDERLAETTLEGWWAELVYNEAEQRWQIEWIDQDDELLD